MVTRTIVRKEHSSEGKFVRQIVEKDNWGSGAMTAQTVINAFNFPFTLNPGSGCFWKCIYCYLQQPFFARHVDAPCSMEMNYKKDFVDRLVHDLRRFRDLPQYLKRVQIGVATEVFHPKMIEYYQPRKILEAFRDHGQDWMVHIVTKSNRILDDVELICEMKHQVQIEVSFVTLDEEAYRTFETGTPHPKCRLEIVEEFAKRGVFVRAMCMPVLRENKLTTEGGAVLPVFRNRATGEQVGMHTVGRANKGKGLRYYFVKGDAKVKVADISEWEPVILKDHSKPDEMKKTMYDLGAKAFKSKDLNYYFVQELVTARDENRPPVEQKGRFEDPKVELLEKSGEPVVDDNGAPIEVAVRDFAVPKKDWTNGLPPPIKRPMMNYGYRDISDIDWVDCV